MSFLERPLPCDDDFSLRGSKRTSGSLADVAQFVNPQYTQLGFLTPEASPTDATPRRTSFALSEKRSTYFSGSSAASSFASQSGCGTPSSSTPGSSASNSRRQSLLPESQYYLSAISSSPSNRPQKPARAAVTDQLPLQESSLWSYITSTDTASLITDGAAACMPGGDFTIVAQTDSPWLYGRAVQPAQIDESTILSRDLEAEFNNPIAAGASHTFELNQPLFNYGQPTIFESPPPQPDTEMYDAAGDSSPNAPLLAPPFEGWQGKYDTDSLNSNAATADLIRQTLNSSSHNSKRSLSAFIYHLPSDDDSERDHAASQTVNKRNKRQKQRQDTFNRELWPSGKPHKCRHCKYACNRQEHLRRHEMSVHDPKEMLPCAFDGCIDRRTGGPREIICRWDNLKAHYTKTHFKYGSSEKGGKNYRKSMKAAHEKGLSVYDPRWTLLLDRKMNVNHEIKDHLHVWKMLGYSILETRDTKVQDVVPDWQGLGDKTLQKSDPLQKADPRWRALWDGTLTFDKAMERGQDMKESEAQGLLGVTMLETEAMGIKHLDPRWTEILSGRMSVEQSEKLGVKHRNPVWKEVARHRTRL